MTCTLFDRMLRRLSPLEEGDLGEIFEREFEEGVQIDYPPRSEEPSTEDALGGIITTSQQSRVDELPQRRRPRRR